MTGQPVGCVPLDVSALAAPEPLQQALEALADLAGGEYLHLRHRRYPRLLYERLAARGFGSITCRGTDGFCEVFIWHLDDSVGRARASEASSGMTTWVE